MGIPTLEGTGVIGSARMKDLPEFSGWFGPEKIRFDSFLDRETVFFSFRSSSSRTKGKWGII